MESQYYNKTNILDDIGNSVNEEVVSKKEAYEYMRGVNNQCKLQTAKMLTRQKEITSPTTENTRCHLGGNSSNDPLICEDEDNVHFDEHVTNLNDLKAPMVRKIYSQKQQQICNDRNKKRTFKHFASAKDTNRKNRSVAAPRRVASGPAKVDGSSSSSDEGETYDSRRLISAPDPAPSIHMKIPYIRNRKRSPTNRAQKIYVIT